MGCLKGPKKPSRLRHYLLQILSFLFFFSPTLSQLQEIQIYKVILMQKMMGH